MAIPIEMKDVITKVVNQIIKDDAIKPQYGPKISDEMRRERQRKILEGRAAYHNNKLRLFEAQEQIKEYEKLMGWIR